MKAGAIIWDRLPLTRRDVLHRAGFVVLTTIAYSDSSEADMIEPKTFAEQLLYATTRVVGLDAGGTPIKTGTGFFFNFKVDESRLLPALITNKHVVEGTSAVELVLHTKEANAARPTNNTPVRITASLGAGWIPHPNGAVDLCALPIGNVLNSLSPPSFFRALDDALIPSHNQLEALDAVEDVLMVGYPNGLWDEVNNYPLTRRGITASHPGVPFYLTGYPNVPLTVVDVASFGGSSGSPVFIYNNGTYADKVGNTVVGSRFIFLGVLFSGPVMQSDGQIVVKEVPTAQVQVPRMAMMLNLGYIIASSEITGLRDAVFHALQVKQ